MKCPNCLMEWSSEPSVQPSFCPFCGTLLQPPKGQKKESFEYVWATIEEDNLKKARLESQAVKSYESALSYYLMAWNQNPQYAPAVARFLLRHPYSSAQFARIPDVQGMVPVQSLFPFLQGKYKAAAKLLLHALMRGHQESLAVLYRLLEEAAGQTDGQEPAFGPDLFEEEILTPLQAKEVFDGGELPVSAHLLMAWKRKDAAETLKQFHQFLQLPETGTIRLANAAMLESICQIPVQKESREDFVKTQMEQGNLPLVLQGLYRPLAETEHEFDHLPGLVPACIQWLEDHPEQRESFLAYSKERLEKEEMLRGIHLVLQQILNSKPEWSDSIQELLDLHYQKVYMKPYSWISSTDFVVDSNQF